MKWRCSEQRTAESQQRTAKSQQRTAESQQRTAESQQRTAESQQRTAESQQRTAESQQPKANSENSQLRQLDTYHIAAITSKDTKSALYIIIYGNGFGKGVVFGLVLQIPRFAIKVSFFVLRA